MSSLCTWFGWIEGSCIPLPLPWFRKVFSFFDSQTSRYKQSFDIENHFSPHLISVVHLNRAILFLIVTQVVAIGSNDEKEEDEEDDGHVNVCHILKVLSEYQWYECHTCCYTTDSNHLPDHQVSGTLSLFHLLTVRCWKTTKIPVSCSRSVTRCMIIRHHLLTLM